MDATARRALNQTMRSHEGLLTTQRAEAIGVDRKALSRATERGEVRRLRQRVYSPPAVPLDWRLEMMADLEACWRDAWAAYSAAMRIHGLRVRRLPSRRELVVVGTARPTVRGGVEVHRATRLEDIDQAEVDGIAVTSVARTLIDMARRLHRSERLMLLDDAIMSDAVSRELLHERASALSRGRLGVSTYVEMTGADGALRFRSVLEKDGASLLRQAGLADMQCNVVPRDAPEAGLTDVVSEADRLIIDWDGLRFHAGRRARQRDNEKANAAALGGYLSLRFTWYDQRHRPGYVIDTVRQAVLSRRP